MKIIACFCFFLFTFSSSFINSSFAQWVSANGPYGGNYTAMEVSGSTLIAGKYRSTNNGANWIAMDVSGFRYQYITDFAASGTDLYAVNYYGVFRSTNSGASWTEITGSIGANGTFSIGASNNTIYIGSQGKVFISTNNGANWTTSTSGLSSNNIFSVFANGTNVLISANGLMYHSTNSGTNWAPVAGMQTHYVRSFAYVGSNYYAATDSGVFTSTNTGANWVRISSGIPADVDVTSITSNSNGLFAGSSHAGIFKSTNNGANWTAVNNGLRELYITNIASLGTDVFCTTTKGIWRSTNSGLTWQESNAGYASKDISYFSSIGNTIFAGSFESGDLFRSTDDGNSWVPVTSNLSFAYVRGLTVKGTNIFLSLYTNDTASGIYKSTNNGTNWIKVSTEFATTLASNSDKIFAGFIGGFKVSTNDGASWIASTLPNPSVQVNNVTANGNIVLATQTPGYYVSTNGGTNWTAGTYPAGTQFTDFSIGSPNIWAIGSGLVRGLFRSTNQGANFSQVTTPGLTYAAIEINNDLFCATDSGVFHSTNNGANWIKRSQGLVINTSNPYYSSTATKFFFFNNYMYAGTFFSSVLKTPLTYLTGVQSVSTEIPEKFLLQQNYPNPFNPATKINFSLPKNSFVNLRVYNTLGREVAILVNEKLSAGSYAYDFNGEKLSSGVYYYKLETENFSETKKMVLIK